MDNLHHDPLLGPHARALSLLRRPLREKNNSTPRSGALHYRLGPGHRSQVRGVSVRRSNVLRARLRHRLHCRSHVHRGDRH